MGIHCHFTLSQMDGSLAEIHTKFHVIHPGFICCPCWNMTWVLDKFKSWNFHDICQENDGISIGLGVIFNQTTEGDCFMKKRLWLFVVSLSLVFHKNQKYIIVVWFKPNQEQKTKMSCDLPILKYLTHKMKGQKTFFQKCISPQFPTYNSERWMNSYL